MKKKVIIAGVIVFLILITMGILILRQPCEINNISIRAKDGDSKIMVVEKLMTSWLGKYKHRRTCIKSWISGYQISEIKISGSNNPLENPFRASVTYSIDPKYRDDETKTVELLIERENGAYTVKEMK